MEKLVTPQCAGPLAQLIEQSKTYAILINEGVVALSLLSTHANGVRALSFLVPSTLCC